MLLRVSSQTSGDPIDLRAVTDPGAAADCGIPNAESLLAYTDAILGDDDRALEETRDTLRARVGSEALVDAAAVASNFERMNRIADSTGLPLDPPMQILTEELREELQLEGFHSAQNTRAPALATRTFGPLLRAGFPLLVKLASRLASKKR